ncbi:hypothetical protein SBOR_4712 [Sclerotinia borealis F-4128]|uniref:Uncharacterized protein n=1 Tax=Sclerotinia borealis (strain F-4128) TaxID=1432307 RepID=W9CK77_SCLBF|nr:hypothetical protein SBOR_4712 [Sclerotinia borealis F-4128]
MAEDTVQSLQSSPVFSSKMSSETSWPVSYSMVPGVDSAISEDDNTLNQSQTRGTVTSGTVGLQRSICATDIVQDNAVQVFRKCCDIHYADCPNRRPSSRDITTSMESQNEAIYPSIQDAGNASDFSQEMGIVQSTSSKGSRQMDMSSDLEQAAGAQANSSEDHTIEDSLITVSTTQPSHIVHEDIITDLSNESLSTHHQRSTYPSTYHDEMINPQPFSIQLTDFNRKINSDQESLQAEMGYIHSMRLNIWSLRSKIHEARIMLREKQEIKSKADDQYMIRLNEHEFNTDVREPRLSISDLRNFCRDVRDEYGPMEDECNDLENQLSSEEFQLTKREHQFYSRWHFPSEPEVHTTNPYSEDHVYFPYAGFDIEETKKPYHPLVANYLSKLGDLDLLKEDIQDVTDEKMGLEQQKETREAYNLTLDSESQSWLDKFDEMISAIFEDLHRTKAEVAVLREECDAHGLLDPDGEPKDLQNLVQFQFQHEEDLNANGNISEYVKFPLLLPFPCSMGNKNEIHDRCSNPDQSSDASNGRVNEWMLRILRSSPLHVRLLAACHSTFREVTDGDRGWQLQVLARWYMDETNKRPPELNFHDSNDTAETDIDFDNLTVSNERISNKHFSDGATRTGSSFSLGS